jgi:hypothetical protein
MVWLYLAVGAALVYGLAAAILYVNFQRMPL